MKKLLTLLAFVLVTFTANAQNWSNYVGKHLYLTKYGGYENNHEINAFYPSGKNANEYILLIDGNMIMGNTLNGNRSYKYTINNNILNISNSKESNWIKILRTITNGIVTVDKNGTYRYYSFTQPNTNPPSNNQKPNNSPSYTPSQSYTPTYTPPPSNNERRRVERTCTSCNGTGLIPDNPMHRCSYLVYPDGCNYGTCPRCSQSHCIRNTIHKRCYSCDGTGKRVTYEKSY